METERIELFVENIGGIDETTIELSPGVAILTGRNATNRTSLLQAVMAALGSDQATIKGDADEARINLQIGDTTYTRRFTRQNGTIVTDGDPYLDDPTLAELFAFLLEQNEARQAVARGDDLREIIMRAVDTDQIESRISQLESEREDIDSELDKISSLKQQLPELEQQKSDLRSQIDDKQGELSNINEDIESVDADIQEKRDEQTELENKLGELNDVRGQIETIRRQLDTHQDSIDALQEERADLKAKREEYSDVSDERINDIKADIQRLRHQREQAETTLDELQTVIEFNENFRDGNLDLFSDLQDDETADSDVTDQLLADADANELVCWTCGSEIDMGQIDAMLDRLRDLRSQTIDKLDTFEAQIDDLEAERAELETQQRQYDQLHTRLDEINNEIQEHEDQLAKLNERENELTEEIETLEDEVETLRTDEQSDLIDLHAEANRLELEIDRLEDDRQDVIDEIDRIEERIEQRDQLEAQREELQAEIEDHRTRIERLERQAVDEFNDHMDAVLDILAFENLERVWIERTEQRVRKGRKKVTKSQFDLHIVRSTESGSVYEDTVEHLSESEREVTGLVFALAGYLAHDLHEDVPFMLLDSLEALDADRIDALIDYFQDYAEYLLVALLEDDATAVNPEYQRVTDI